MIPLQADLDRRMGEAKRTHLGLGRWAAAYCPSDCLLTPHRPFGMGPLRLTHPTNRGFRKAQMQEARGVIP
jgi:hypothetical protein